ncbi:TAXI family TRAP transporter solute-binding subunit [Streptomyces sp. NPDC002490]|uniref:TAXI family TRAP transporter solute-binding subunit n=1 Tax=Streptomyces sp. NPDC002490 TaxID=3154416 RepID=UPI00331A8D6C
MVPVLSSLGRRRALRGGTAALAVLGLLLWWLLPLDDGPPNDEITVSTGVRSGVYERYGMLLRTALKEDMPDLEVRLKSSEGSQQNVERVAAGTADFTIAAADAVEAYRLDRRPGADRLRGLARLYDDYVQLVVPRTSPVHEVEQLRGKRVAVGQLGSGVRLIAERVLSAGGLDPEHDIQPVSIGIDTMTSALKADRIDAFFWSGGLPTASVHRLSEEHDIRFVEIGGLVDALHDQGGASRYYRSSVIPADAYPSAQQGAEVTTLAVANLLVTTDRAGTELTERLTRTVIDSRDHIGRNVHAVQLVDLRTAIYTAPLELHRGARRYYRSVKP